MKKRAAIYIRVSTRDQIDGFSLDDQLHTCEHVARQQEMVVVTIYREPGKSAYKGHRPEFERMLADAQHGAFDVVIVYKFDRFSRQTTTQLNQAEELEQVGVELLSATEPADRKTAMGKLSFTMSSALAQFTSDNIGERVASARQEAVNQGIWVGPVPIGYTRNKETRVIEPDDTASAVKLAYELYTLGTHSYTSIADNLNALGYRIYNPQTRTRNLFSKDAVRGILQNPIYIGKVRLKDRTYEGKHEPLIDQETWDAVQSRLKIRAEQGRASLQSRGKRTDVVGVLAKIASCADCGLPMHLQNGVNRAHPYYLCSGRGKRTCTASMVRIDLIDEQVYELFACLAIPETWYNRIIEAVQEKLQPQPSAPVVDRDALKRKVERLALVFANGDIDEKVYERERKGVQALLDKMAERVAPQPVDVQRILEVLKELPGRLRNGDQATQRNIVREVFDTVWIEKHRIVAIRPTTVYLPMVEAVKGLNGEPGGNRTHDQRIKSPMLYP